MKLLLTVVVCFLGVSTGIWADSGEAPPPPAHLPPANPASPENINETLHLEVIHLTRAQPPQIWDHKLILTFDADPEARYVAAAFSNEAFRQQHVFFKNENNVFFLVYDIPENTPTEIDYRLIVDGLWIRDPSNPLVRTGDPNGELSYVTLRYHDRPRLYSPTQKADGVVEFRYRGRPGLQIALIGNFNNWDPFQDFLVEEPGRPGEYSLSLPLPAGVVAYAYVIGTRTELDPLNPKTVSDGTGAVYSFFRNVKKPAPSVLEANLPTNRGNGDS
jgi:hypothetical protein